MAGIVCFLSMVIAQIAITAGEPVANVVEETQHAVCNISTEEIRATANASITRQLKGVCHTDDLHAKLLDLEERLMRKIERLLQKSLNTDSIKMNGDEDGSVGGNVYGRFNYKNVLDASPTRNEASTPAIDNKMASREKRRDFPAEFRQNNSVVHDAERGDTFVYYWRVEDATATLGEKDVFVTSPHFLVKGTINFIKLSPHHLGSRYACLELDHLLPNYLKYRFVVLNQYNAKSDLSSQLLCKLESFAKTFRVSYEKLSKYYIANDAIVVKLLIYLDL